MRHHPLGSLWRRWDLHFHTPSSFDYQDKSIADKEIVEGLLAAEVAVVAVTDHHLIDVKRIKSLQTIAGDRLTILPGIEFRTDLGGKESIHLIGIFSETAEIESIWTKLQGNLNLTKAEVSKQGDDRVYVEFKKAAELIKELGGIVSVHAGKKSNSIENIGNNEPFKLYSSKSFGADL